MRICLVAHSFPPLGWTGVENHCAALAAALARAGHAVEVFVPRPGPEAERSQRREVAPAGYAVTWLTLTRPAATAADHLDRPGAARAFEEFLERERPEVVHFQHLAKLGVGLIEVAHRRGLPLVYTAHDYFPVCHRLTLLRPDLSPCSTLGDPAACARCDACAALLDRLGRLGDYQMGVLRGQLGDEEAAELASALAQEAPESVRAERRRLDARRAAAFALVERVLAPSRFLAERLVECGLDARKVVVQACGIPVDELAALAPPRASGRQGRGLRFGYVGGIAKHKGVHHLLEAFAGLHASARLALFGDGSDHAYVEHMRAEAGAAGAAWHGRFEAHALPRVMEQIDVLVLPSAWYENAPFVIREAHAARRPVIASRIGALPESVRDGVDGLLVDPGSPRALAAAMQRLALEPELLAQLVDGCPPPRSIDAQAAELVELYGELVAARGAPPAPVLAHLTTFVERQRTLESLPQRELLARVLHGLGELGRDLGVAGAEHTAALPAVERIAERARDRRRESEWLRESLGAERAATRAAQRALAEEGAARAALTAERDWLGATLAEAQSERDWLRTTLGALERQRDGFTGVVAALTAERDWLRSTLDAERERARWLDEQARAGAAELEWLRELRTQLDAERDWLHSSVAGLEAERDGLRASSAAAGAESTAALAEFEGELARLRAHATALAEHERWLRGECAALLAELGAVASGPEPEPANLLPAFVAARQRLARLSEELAWRRAEMERARADGGAAFKRLLARSALGRRMRGWHGGQGGPA